MLLSQGGAMKLPRAAVSAMKPSNLDEFRLRNFLDRLDRHGELPYNDDHVALIDVAPAADTRASGFAARY